MPYNGGNSVRGASSPPPPRFPPRPRSALPPRPRSTRLLTHSLPAATSGINGALTQAQKVNGIPDSPELFEADTLKSAAGMGRTDAPEYTPPLAKVLTHESGAAVDWLCSNFGLDLSLVSRLGGHSQPRTHRGAQKFPGFTITCVCGASALAAPRLTRPTQLRAAGQA